MAAWQELEWVSEHLHPKGGVGSDEDEARLAEIFRTCHGDQNLIGQFMYLEVGKQRADKRLAHHRGTAATSAWCPQEPWLVVKCGGGQGSDDDDGKPCLPACGWCRATST